MHEIDTRYVPLRVPKSNPTHRRYQRSFPVMPSLQRWFVALLFRRELTNKLDGLNTICPDDGKLQQEWSNGTGGTSPRQMNQSTLLTL